MYIDKVIKCRALEISCITCCILHESNKANNNPVATMMGLRAVTAVVAVFLFTRGSNYMNVKAQVDETEDVSKDVHVFSAHR